jgi:thiazole synthase ThiGH ThiG subunit
VGRRTRYNLDMDTLQISDREFHSRLIVGTGK